MTTQVPLLIDVLREHIERKDWDKAILLLSQLRAADEADLLSELNSAERKELLPHLSYEELAKILANLKKDDVRNISEQVNRDTFSQAMDRLSPDYAADILHRLPAHCSNEILEGMAEKRTVQPLLGYADDSAGGLMTPEFVALTRDMTVAQAIAKLRKVKPPRETIDVLYVVDRHRKLVGKVTLRQLILAGPATKIADIMEGSPVSVASGAGKEECVRIMERYGLTALPVVDGNQRLIGLIRLQEVAQVAEEEATEDMYHMVGLSEHERVFAPIRHSIRRRLPWLCINLGTAILAGFVVNLFESTIARVLVLAAFIPIIAGQGGNAGAQTLTIVVRSLALGEVSLGNARKVILREVTLAAANGLAVAVLAGAVAYLWKGDLWLGVVLAAAMFLTMMVAGLSGALVPLVLRLLRIDPALASTVVVTTVTDVCGFVFLLGAATLMLNYLP